MTIFSDFHQQDLYYSLQLLFEKRLGYNMFRPIGLEWYKEGFWKVYDHPDTAEQYLGLRQGFQPTDGTLPLNHELPGWGNMRDLAGYFLCEDKHNNTTNKAITLDKFKQMDVDIVIASIPAHIKPYKELARMKNAKFIFQMGNVFSEVIPSLHEIPNLMTNTLPSVIPSTLHYIQYHQEFDLNIFRPNDLKPERQITSFINILGANGGAEDYYTLKSMLPDINFRSYGSQCDDGVMDTTSEIAMAMRQSMFGFMVKSGSDGYGHILHNFYACGVPVIVNYSEYKDKIGGKLLVPNETCIVAEVNDNMERVKDIIENISSIQYEFMRKECYRKFKEVVDFDKEAEKIKEFIKNLQ